LGAPESESPMTESTTVRFTLAQKVRGLLVAGVVAWLLSLAAMYASAHLFDFIERAVSGPPANISDLDNAVGWTLMGAVYLGLPAAFVVVLAFGFPVMSYAEKTGATSFHDAAVAGLICGAIVGAAVALLAVLTQRPDQGGALLEPLEWIKLAVDATATLATGAITGISARLASGRPKLG
jgi:hypothetical protein